MKGCENVSHQSTVLSFPCILFQVSINLINISDIDRPNWLQVYSSLFRHWVIGLLLEVCTISFQWSLLDSCFSQIQFKAHFLIFWVHPFCSLLYITYKYVGIASTNFTIGIGIRLIKNKTEVDLFWSFSEESLTVLIQFFFQLCK